MGEQDLRDTDFRVRYFTNNSEDRLSLTYQFPHGWARTAVRPHVHFIPLGTGAGADRAGDIIWQMDYAWSLTNSGQVIPAASGWTTIQATSTIVLGEQYTERVVSFGLIEPPEWADASSHLLIIWRRLGADGSDTYGGRAGLLSFDVHCQITHNGSFVEFPT